jgi:hypothetical protein
MTFGLTCQACGVTDRHDNSVADAKQFGSVFEYLDDARARGWMCDHQPVPGPVRCPKCNVNLRQTSASTSAV